MTLMTVKEVAQMLRLKECSIYKKVRLGEIPCLKMKSPKGEKNRIRFSTDAINKWLRGNTKKH